MIFAEWAILLLGSLKVRALCAIYLASHINAERRLWSKKDKKIDKCHLYSTKHQLFEFQIFQGYN